MGIHSSPGRTGAGLLFLLLLGGLLAVSCGGSGGPHPVHGKVLHRGEPIKGAVVTFHPRGGDEVTALRPSGVSGDDGSFSLSTGRKEGAPAGGYVVTVVWLMEQEPAAGMKVWNTEGPPDAEDRLRGRYADRKNSRITGRIRWLIC